MRAGDAGWSWSARPVRQDCPAGRVGPARLASGGLAVAGCWRQRPSQGSGGIQPPALEVFYLRGEGATFHRWLSALPAGLVQSRPRLLVAQAFLASHGGRGATVEPLLDAAEHAYASAAEEPLSPLLAGPPAYWSTSPRRLRSPGPISPSSAATPRALAVFASRALAESREGERMLVSVIQ